MASKKDFSVFLKEARATAGLTQRQVSDKLGYETPQFVSNWERGVSFPPVSQLKILAGLYKISAETLFEHVLEEELRITTEQLKKKFKTSR